MQKYVKAYFVARAKRGDKYYLALVSEVFSSKEEAEYFCSVFRHNYYADVIVVKGPMPKEYVVIVRNVWEGFVRSNYLLNENFYEFANWKYDSRG